MLGSRVPRGAFERLERHEGKLSRAVLRGGGGGKATSTAKRRQRVPMPCDRAPKSWLAGATVVDTSGGRADTPQRPGVLRSYRGPRTGRRDTRVAREPERPCHLRRGCRSETRLTNSRLIPSSGPGLAGTKRGQNDGIAERRQRSAARRAAGSRSVP